MPKTLNALILCAVAMAACSRAPVFPKSEPLPAYKTIIFNNKDKLFSDPATAKNIFVGTLRLFGSAIGSELGTCLRATTDADVTTDTLTYIVFVEKGTIGDRRIALPEDGCEKETYEPLTGN